MNLESNLSLTCASCLYNQYLCPEKCLRTSFLLFESIFFFFFALNIGPLNQTMEPKHSEIRCVSLAALHWIASLAAHDLMCIVCVAF